MAGNFSIRILVLFATWLALTSGTVQASGGGYLYALRDVPGAPNRIYGFQVNELTGALTILPGFPVLTHGAGSGGTSAEELVYDPARRRLYALNNGSNNLSAYSVNLTTGVLTELPFHPLALGAGNWRCLGVHPSGSPLVVGNAAANQMASFTVTDTGIQVAIGSPFNTDPACPMSCAFSRDGRYVYTGGAAGNAIAGFNVNADTGVLTALPGSPFNSGGTQPLGYATDSSGRLFTSNLGTLLRAFTTVDGVLFPVTGNPFPSGLRGGIHGLVHPAGYYLMADGVFPQVGVYRINGSGPGTTLSPVTDSPFFIDGVLGPMGLAVNRSGAYVFVANNTRNITTFSFVPSSGVLTNRVTQPNNTLGPSGSITGLAYAGQPAPTAFGSGLLYALEDGDISGNRIHGFSVNELTGTLTTLPGFPVATGGNGFGRPHSEQLVYDPGASRLYALNDGSNTISAYTVNRKTGALTALPFSPIPLGPWMWNCLAVHPAGSPLVAGTSSTNLAASFNITENNATPAPGSPFTGAVGPFSCAFSRDGRYFYTGGNLGTGVSAFSVNAETGVLTPLPGSPFPSGASGPMAYATDSTGRLFVANYNSGQVRVFNTADGAPSPAAGNPFPSGMTEAVRGLLHPAGYYLVADRVDNRVGVYRIAGSGPATTLTPVSGSPFPSGGFYTDALAFNQSGDFLFAANGFHRNISSYVINPATGSLTGVSILPRDSAGNTGLITGLAYVPGLNFRFLPIILH